MSKTLVLLAACACTADDLDGLIAPTRGDVDLVHLGALRLTHDGDPVLQPDTPAVDLGRRASRLGPGTSVYTVEVVAAGERLGVRLPISDVELIVWLDREDAVTWTVADTAGGLVRGDAVALDAGVPVEILDARPGWSLVHVEREGLWVDAWIPADDADQIRVGDPASHTPARADGEVVWVAVPSDLYDGSTGPVFGALVPTGPPPDLAWDDDPTSIVQIGAAEAGRIPVEAVAAGVRVRAWVDEDRVVEPPSGLRGWGFGSSGGWGCGLGQVWPRPTLLAGAALYAEPNGAVIGAVLDDLDVAFGDVGEDEAGWREVHFHTVWGRVPVWILADEVAIPDLW